MARIVVREWCMRGRCETCFQKHLVKLYIDNACQRWCFGNVGQWNTHFVPCSRFDLFAMFEGMLVCRWHSCIGFGAEYDLASPQMLTHPLHHVSQSGHSHPLVRATASSCVPCNQCIHFYRHKIRDRFRPP